ncbi:class I SAM-dependent methyltransferase [Filobacillus milosensis]|uniref:Uncharacterized methyltransferase E3U55_11395 n=1 Tax=Filobacillus milosensis TaxID=94137 RepID=A0A4Y8IJ00_9BACI|nr:class I SAM-dependent methyltransferase [Filobacillus milosensis]TFB18870.1 class I SAM-dependent methyltransferase [Filobacillus milosensis]
MGREFMNIFDEWADSYNDAVSGQNIEYKEVFEHYEEILDEVASKAKGKTIEFGVGTGNLFDKLINYNLDVIGVEPNEKMLQIAKHRFPDEQILDGDLINFPKSDQIDSIVSSYTFHHLTDNEKQEAFELYYDVLSHQGQVIFADTIFQDEESHQKVIRDAEEKGYSNLAKDLLREYYTTIPKLEHIIKQAGFTVRFKQLNNFVWLIHARKL